MMFSIAFLAFALMAYIIYNTDLVYFSSFVRTLETLFSAMLSAYTVARGVLSDRRF